jgi:hypothetical protein
MSPTHAPSAPTAINPLPIFDDIFSDLFGGAEIRSPQNLG